MAPPAAAERPRARMHRSARNARPARFPERAAPGIDRPDYGPAAQSTPRSMSVFTTRSSPRRRMSCRWNCRRLTITRRPARRQALPWTPGAGSRCRMRSDAPDLASTARPPRRTQADRTIRPAAILPRPAPSSSRTTSPGSRRTARRSARSSRSPPTGPGAAEAADGAPAEGRRPLHGVPTAIKDLTLTAGVRTTFGSAAFADFVPPVDADVVRAAARRRHGQPRQDDHLRAGLLALLRGRVAPPARNPWDLGVHRRRLQRRRGGGGRGRAGAGRAGLRRRRLGAHPGGAVRPGRLQAQPRCWSPAARSASAAFGLPTHGPLGPHRHRRRRAARRDGRPGARRALPRRRRRPTGGYLAAARARRARPAADRPVHHADARRRPPSTPPASPPSTRRPPLLAAAGHEVVEVGRRRSARTVVAAVRDRLVRARARPGAAGPRGAELLPLTRLTARARRGGLGAGTLMATLAELQVQVRRGACARTAGYDLLLCPTLAARRPGRLVHRRPATRRDDFDRQRRFSPYCAVFNVTGQPSVSLPVATDRDGMPVGVLLTGRAGADALLLAAAAAARAGGAGWRDRHPAIWRATPSATVNWSILSHVDAGCRPLDCYRDGARLRRHTAASSCW